MLGFESMTLVVHHISPDQVIRPIHFNLDFINFCQLSRYYRVVQELTKIGPTTDEITKASG